MQHRVPLKTKTVLMYSLKDRGGQQLHPAANNLKTVASESASSLLTVIS